MLDQKEEIIDFEGPIVEYNFHAHTKRCGHAIGEDYEYVEAAIKKGYKVLGISDHCPHKELSLPDQRMEWSEFPEYLESIHELRKKYSDKIDIYVGLECECYDYHLSQLKELKEYVDYLILGQHHYIENQITKSYRSNQELTSMLEDMKCGIEEGLFLYIAHPDYFLKERPLWDEVAINVTHALCHLSKKYDLPLELNHKMLKTAKHEKPESWESSLSFWKMVKDYDCKVCIGMDIHNPKKFFDDTSTELMIIDILKLNVISKEELIKKIKNT